MGYIIDPRKLSLPQQVADNADDIKTLFDNYPFNYRGDWNVASTYTFNDLVFYDGGSYVMTKKEIIVGVLPSNSIYWQLLVSSSSTVAFASGQIVNETFIGDTTDTNPLVTKNEIDKKQSQLVDNVEHRIGVGVSHTVEYNEMLEQHFAEKQNKGFLNYTFDGGQQDREFFQTYDIEKEITATYPLHHWLDTFNNLSRTTLIGSIIVIDQEGNRGTGTFNYTNLPNQPSTLIIEVMSQELDEYLIIASGETDESKAKQIKIYSNSETLYQYASGILKDLSPFTCYTKDSKCSKLIQWRFQIITIFGNNNGKLGFPE